MLLKVGCLFLSFTIQIQSASWIPLSTQLKKINDRIQACTANITLKLYPLTTFFSVPKLLKLASEWWFQPEESIVECLKREQNKSITSSSSEEENDDDDDDGLKMLINSDSSDSDYHLVLSNQLFDSHNSTSSEEDFWVPTEGKKTYCGEYIDVINSKRIFKTPFHDFSAFSKISDLSELYALYYCKLNTAETGIPVDSVEYDHKSCYIQYLSLFSSINVFFHEGELYFRFQKYNEYFIFSFFEWSLIIENRPKILKCMLEQKKWLIKVEYGNRSLQWYHVFKSLYFNGKRLVIEVDYSVAIDDESSIETCTLHNTMSSKREFSLNRTELSNLLFPFDTTFRSCVHYLSAARINFNITMVALCNIIKKALIFQQQTSELEGEMTSSEISLAGFLSLISQLFGVHNYHTQVRLRSEIHTILQKLRTSEKQCRDICTYATIQESLSQIFPSQLVYLRKIYNTLHCNNQTREPFTSCKISYCINPLCFSMDTCTLLHTNMGISFFLLSSG